MWEEPVPAPELELPVADALYAAERAVSNNAEAQVMGGDMTARQTLYARHFADAVYGMPLSEIARRTETSMANISQLISRMEARGLAVRDVHPYDRRIRLVSLTDRGHFEFDRMSRRLRLHERRLAWVSLGGEPAAMIEKLAQLGEAPPWHRRLGPYW